MSKPFFMHDSIYHNAIYISYGVPPKEFIKQIRKYTGNMAYSLDNINNHDGKMIVFENSKGHTLIWVWTRHKRIDMLVHEIHHVVNYVMREVGIPFNEHTDEAQAYYLQHILYKLLIEK